MNFSLYIAKRYLFAKSRNNAINIMTLIASSGIVVASAALFIVLSVFAGLKDFSLQFSNYSDPDLKVLPISGKRLLWTDDDNSTLIALNGIDRLSQTIEERAIIKSENKNLLATIKGVDSNYISVTQVDRMVTKGQWVTAGSNEVVSGWGISNSLSFGVIDFLKPLTLYVPKPGRGQLSSIKGAYNSVVVTNVGLFDINEQLNNEIIFADIELARQLLNYSSNEISSLEIKLHPEAEIEDVKTIINNAFENRVIIKDRQQLNDALYKMLNTENLAIYLIFTLVIIIALFNVIGSIIMMILDKKASLNTLFNLGVEIKDIKSIFFFQGSLLTIFSGVIGLAIGCIIVFLQQNFQLVMLTPNLPYPVRFNIANAFIVITTIAVLGFIASRIASQRINKQLLA
ncbi:MAG: ABC transporter permease, partial [Winogradskyella sp.]|nr:ABC transporter permease [Winogradskyella sp.]